MNNLQSFAEYRRHDAVVFAHGGYNLFQHGDVVSVGIQLLGIHLFQYAAGSIGSELVLDVAERLIVVANKLHLTGRVGRQILEVLVISHLVNLASCKSGVVVGQVGQLLFISLVSVDDGGIRIEPHKVDFARSFDDICESLKERVQEPGESVLA